MKIDILIAGSANDAFFSRIAFARLSLDALGGDYRNARVVAALAEYEQPEIPARWAPYFENIDVVWSNPDGVPNPGWDLQHRKRFEVMRDDADVAIVWDADVCALRPFDDLLERVARDQVLAGVIAHYHFPIDGARGDPDVDWPRIATAVLGRDIDRPHRYLFGRAPGAGGGPIADPEQRPRAPFYLNYGVVMGPPALLRQMFEREQVLRPAVSLVIGDVEETLTDFPDRIAGSPLCFVIVDLKSYSSARSAMQVFGMDARLYVPAMPVFFNNVKRLVSSNSRCGEELAIGEFNASHELRLIEEKPGYQLPNFHILQVLDHPVRTGAVTPRMPIENRGF